MGLNTIGIKRILLTDVTSFSKRTIEERLQGAAATWSIKSGLDYGFYQAQSGYFLGTKGA